MKKEANKLQIQLPLVSFSAWYKSLKGPAKKKFRIDTEKACFITRKTFDNWVNEVSSPSINMRKLLFEIHNQNFAFVERNRNKISFKDDTKPSTGQHAQA